jgi:hypothetical protein
MKTRREWDNEFNSLPYEIRTIACAVSNEQEINALKREKARLIKRHEQSLKGINEHIANLEKYYSNNFAKETKEDSNDTE